MASIFLFLGLTFLLTFLIGRILERIRVPWIFAAVFVGSALAVYNPFFSITSSSVFNFLAQLGMYFLLFIIGFEINLKKLRKSSKFIFKATFIIIFLEAVFGTILVHFLFNASWFISFLVALSFATVGEAILIPILDEFKIINSKLGQSIIGIGTLDDIIEVLLLIIIGILIGSQIHPVKNIIITLVLLTVLFAFTLALRKLKPKSIKFKFTKIEVLFLPIIFILFFFIGIGGLVHIAPIAALLAGISLNAFIPDNRIKKIKNSIRSISYGFFAPIFFLEVGASMSFSAIFYYPLALILVVVVSNISKIVGSCLVGKKELGLKQSVLLGIGLSARFSTSIIIMKILFEKGIIQSDTYSVLVASSMIFSLAIPVMFSKLLVKWKIVKKKR